MRPCDCSVCATLAEAVAERTRLHAAIRAHRREPPVCPYCGRIMTWREHDEQGACNDCYEGHAGWLAFGETDR